MTVGEKIRKLRNKIGYSQDTLADKIGTSRQTIYHWENDITSPNIQDIKALSKALDCDHDVFFSENDDDINSTDEVVSDIYKGVKRHWRKIYYNFFLGGALFAGMGFLIRLVSNAFFGSIPSNMPGPAPVNIFKYFSNFTFGVSALLIIIGIVLLIKDVQKQKQYQ